MKIIKIIICLSIISLNSVNANTTEDFDIWLISFQDYAIKKGISKKTLDITMSKVKFLPKVIEYDRYQPEFYEDTYTYINKRTSIKKVKEGKSLFVKNNSLIFRNITGVKFSLLTLDWKKTKDTSVNYISQFIKN